jgi:hypothetical protein
MLSAPRPSIPPISWQVPSAASTLPRLRELSRFGGINMKRNAIRSKQVRPSPVLQAHLQATREARNISVDDGLLHHFSPGDSLGPHPKRFGSLAPQVSLNVQLGDLVFHGGINPQYQRNCQLGMGRADLRYQVSGENMRRSGGGALASDGELESPGAGNL